MTNWKYLPELPPDDMSVQIAQKNWGVREAILHYGIWCQPNYTEIDEQENIYAWSELPELPPLEKPDSIVFNVPKDYPFSDPELAAKNVGKPKELMSLEGWNNIDRNINPRTPEPNGLSCPECCSELYDSNPDIVLTTHPAKKSVHCSECNFTGYRIA